MPTEADFIASIKADPSEHNFLVYADWLEEQGDEFAERVRELAELPDDLRFTLLAAECTQRQLDVVASRIGMSASDAAEAITSAFRNVGLTFRKLLSRIEENFPQAE